MVSLITSSQTHRAFTAIAIIATATLCIGSHAAFAAGYVTLDSFSGNPGSTVTVSGGGWDAGDTVSLYPGDTKVSLGSATVQDDSTFSLNAIIPLQEPQGPLAIKAIDTTDNAEADNSYYVIPLSPTIHYATASHTPHASVQVSGSGFAANEPVTVSLAGATTTTLADSHGNSTAIITLPFVASGLYTVTATGNDSGVSSNDYFWVDTFYPSLTPTDWYVIPGATTTVTATGYAPNEVVTFAVQDGNVHSSVAATTTASGSVIASIPVPYVAGKMTVSASGELSQVQSSVSIEVGHLYPTVIPGSWFAYPGGSITFSGSGFIPGEIVTARIGTVATTTVADAYGTISLQAIGIPYGAKNMVSATFTGAQSASPTTVSIAIGTLSPYLTAASYAVVQGGTAQVQGFSFAPGEPVTVFAGTFSTTTIALADGSTLGVTIPLPYHVSSQVVTFKGTKSKVYASIHLSLQKYKPYLTSSSYYAERGTMVTITGTNYAPNEMVDIFNTVATTTVTTDPNGSFSTGILVPSVTAKNIKVVAKGESTGATSAITIALAAYVPLVEPNTYYALPGTTVTFSGSGYASNESINIIMATSTIATISADSNGTFAYNYPVPYGSSNAVLKFTGSFSKASVTKTIVVGTFSAYIHLSSYYGVSGSPVTIVGNGFAPHENVDITFNGSTIGTAAADATGAILFTQPLPYAASGPVPLTAKGQSSGAFAGATFTVATIYPNFQLGSYAGAPGTSVTFIGSGFMPNEPVGITTDRTGTDAVATFTTDAAGSFNDSSYVLPNDFAEGTLVFTATGTHSLTPKSIVYYVTGASGS